MRRIFWVLLVFSIFVGTAFAADTVPTDIQ